MRELCYANLHANHGNVNSAVREDGDLMGDRRAQTGSKPSGVWKLRAREKSFDQIGANPDRLLAYLEVDCFERGLPCT